MTVKVKIKSLVIVTCASPNPLHKVCAEYSMTAVPLLFGIRTGFVEDNFSMNGWVVWF